MEPQEMERLCNRIAECARNPKGQRRLIEMTIQRSLQPEYQDGAHLLLVDPQMKPPDIYDWTVVPPPRQDLREVVTNRIRRGYLPLGMLKKGPSMDIFADAVPRPYRLDFVRWAQFEAKIIYRTMTGQMPPELGWLDARTEQQSGEVQTREALIKFSELGSLDDDENPRKPN